MGRTIALVVAAGRGSRFGGDVPKQYQILAGRPVLHGSLAAFHRHPQVAAVRAVIHPDDRDLYDGAAAGLDLLEPVGGGASRQDSVRLGLESLLPLAPDRVLIHDGARPLVDAGTITRVIDALDAHDGALAAVAVVDTLKRAGDGEPPSIAETVDRRGLWRAQTPQGFRFQPILDAHRQFADQEATDDAMLAEWAGLGVTLVPGREENLKVTTTDDLRRAEAILAAAGETRTGTGFDVHRFVAGRPLMLAGIEVPHTMGLAGHSDADVALHALTDAILGAIAAGDIGQHFPPSDARWKGAPSDVFLRHAAALVAERRGVIVNVDLTIICERPKIGPHRAAMTARIAELCGIETGRVNIKGKTTEGLGFTGREEGIAVEAIATVRVPRP